jgi:hypothetical protein
MSKHIQSFINANRTAYAKASAVFKAIESKDFASTLAEAGITGPDIRVFATIYVAEATGVNPHPSQRGGALTFKKNTPEYNRVKYLVDVATGVRETRKEAKQAQTHARLTPEVRKAAQAFIKMFDSVEDAVKALRAV